MDTWVLERGTTSMTSRGNHIYYEGIFFSTIFCLETALWATKRGELVEDLEDIA